MRPSSLRPFVAACVLAAAVAVGSPAQAAERAPRAPLAAGLAGDLLGSLRAFLGQATDAFRSLWSASGETTPTADGDTAAGTTAKAPAGPALDLGENGAGIDPNG